MLESLRRSVGLAAATYHFRKSHDVVISFTDAVTKANQALLVLPLDHLELLATMNVLEMLKSTYRDEDITVVADEQGMEVSRLLPRSKFVHLREQSLNGFFLPRKDFLDTIRSRTYDIAIDLNLDIVLPSAYICKASNARVRVGFGRKGSDPFYNFQIQPDPTLEKKLVYDRLANCLRMF